ncbi:MAG: hypothetical protein GF344_18950 [Chitinivibrionales bacterium]|nr:hypothetical protein [Chitinivibrionales bacterium]MBD3358713.1 hypothetical protein [Chitinivibrionales bacterium]
MKRYVSLVNNIGCIAFASVLLCVNSALAAYHCVRPGGSSYGNGSGTNWSNAWNGFGAIRWSTVQPGDTIFVAGGRYNESLRFGASGNSARGHIVVLRAAKTIPACRALGGWSDNFDKTVVIDRQFTCVSTLGQNYITIDGVRDDGIRMVSAQRNDTRICEVGFGHNGSGHITLRNLEIVGTGRGSRYESTGIYAASSTKRETDHVYHNLTIHGASTSIKIHSIDRVKITKCRLYDSDCSGPAHENIIWAQGVNDLVYDGNIAYNYIVEGVFARADNSNWLVCNSVFQGLPGSPTTVYGFATKAGYRNTSMRVFNNTFHNIRNAVMFKSGTTGEVINNIFHSCVSITRGDYNWYSGSDTNGEAHGVAGGDENPFVNIGARDFRLRAGSSPVDRGRNLARYLTADMTGVRRSGAWDIGAYEQGGEWGGTPPPATEEPIEPVEDGSVVIEAESGELSAPMSTAPDAGASGGRYVVTTQDNAGTATYRFRIPKRGYYRLKARVQAPSTANNSFEIRLGNGDTKTWDIPELCYTWREVDVCFREGGSPEAPARPEVVELFEEGTHTLTIIGREDGTKLDRVVLAKAKAEPTSVKGAAARKRVPAVEKARSGVQLRSRASEAGTFSAHGRRVAPKTKGAAGVRFKAPEDMRTPDK